MASPNAIFTELVSTTFRNHKKDAIDNVSKHNALFRRIAEKGQVAIEDGGLTLTQPIEYAENGTYQRYSGYDTLNISASDVITAAEFPWRQIALNVVASGQELRINSGKAQIIKLVKQRVKNAMRTFKNNFSNDIYSNGSLPNQINGLQTLVSDTGANAVGGIDSTTWTFWKNKVQSAAAPLQGGGAIVPGISTMESLMLPLWMALTRGDDQPDLIVSSDEYFAFYEQSLTDVKRYTSSQRAQGGFIELAYKSADVIFDGSSGIPAAHMYFLNTDYLDIAVHKDANLTELPEARPINQDAVVMPILWMGNMRVSNRALQGVLKA